MKQEEVRTFLKERGWDDEDISATVVWYFQWLFGWDKDIEELYKGGMPAMSGNRFRHQR